jgi:hypothetical protein
MTRPTKPEGRDQEEGDESGSEAAPSPDDLMRARASEGEDEKADLLVALSEPKSVTVQRFEEAELLLRSMSPRAVRSHMAKKYGVTRIHASTWVRTVHERWANEAPTEEREKDREHMIEAAWHGVHLAYTRQGMLLDKDGGEHKYANPDAGGARGLLEFIARIKGIMELESVPIHVHLSVEQRVEAASVALRKHYFGEAVPAALPSKTEAIDAHGESVREGEET